MHSYTVLAEQQGRIHHLREDSECCLEDSLSVVDERVGSEKEAGNFEQSEQFDEFRKLWGTF